MKHNGATMVPRIIEIEHTEPQWALKWAQGANRKDWSTCYENDESIQTKQITWIDVNTDANCVLTFTLIMMDNST